MKKAKKDNEKIDSFIEQIINTKILSLQLMPSLIIDTTAVPALRAISQQTQSDNTYDGKILSLTSQKMLKVFSDARQQFRYKQSVPLSKQVQIAKINQTIQYKSIKPTIHLKGKEIVKAVVHPSQNDQNKNTINIQNGSKTKENNVDKKLIQIVRPEYKKNTARMIRQRAYDLDIPVVKTNRVYVTQQQDSQQIPVLKNHKNLKLARDARRSVSPKHQHSKHQISNLSFINKDYQTQTDHSLQIDLQSLGFVAQPKRSSMNILQNEKGNRRERDIRRGKQVSEYGEYKGQIEEQEPWQCDQQEIEQEIKQINQKLSHRANHRQRIKTQYDSKCIPHKANQFFKYNQQPNKKQTKTVRLNLTPIRNKSTSRLEADKKAIIKTPTNKVQVDVKKGPNKYEAQYLVESPADIECQKWKKPQKGLISLQIQKKMRNN